MRPAAEASGYLSVECARGRCRRGSSGRLAAMAKMKPMKAAVEQSLVQLGGGGPPAEMVFGDWYPALRAEGMKRGDTAVAMLLGIPMLVGRKSDGALFAMRDLCPHRGVPLSAGV